MIITRRLLPLAAALTLALSALSCNGNDDDAAPEDPAPPANDIEAPAVLTATLSGEEEVPGPGVEDGSGVAELRLENGEVCYELTATMPEEPTATHVHEGVRGVAGGIVIDLDPAFEQMEAAFVADGCVPAEADVATAVFENPSGYYVNVHSAGFPDGALRGQLTPAS